MNEGKSKSVDLLKKSKIYTTCKFLDTLIGVFIIIFGGVIFSVYMYRLHEVRLWFSNIKDVEREISLRTESGLYYSYYKQLINEPNISLGFYNLMHDTKTEFPREINILERFNIYQEVFLALLYRNGMAWFRLGNPILFYVCACFAFAGFTVAGVGFLGWKVSGHWFFGLLASTWMFTNLDDSTRVFFTVNLREMFALPMFLFQNLFTISILCDRNSRFLYTLTTFFFILFWQFNQFILFLQSLALFGVCLVFPYVYSKVFTILFFQSIAFIFVIIAQFFQPMMITSISLFLNAAIFLSFLIFAWPTSSSQFLSFKSILFRVFFVLLFTGIFHVVVKFFLNVTSDTHIWNFVKAKFGFGVDELPFESAIYICHGAFQFLDWDFMERTRKTGVLPMYLLNFIVVVVSCIYYWIKNNQEIGTFFNPKLLFLTLQSILCGGMAILTLRMKFLWFPQMAVLAVHSLFLMDKFIGRFPKYVVAIALAGSLLKTQYGIYRNQMLNEQEFYDPDTVELMEWIKTLPENSVFTGSMQLLAGVKACTGRPLTNHPHFEDKWLRERTQRLYQIYGRKSIPEVHKILVQEKTGFIILEDSICKANSDGCSTNDLVDITNGHLPDSGYSRFSTNLKRNNTPRFCDFIRKQTPEMQRYFKLVFQNRTFHVYKLV